MNKSEIVKELALSGKFKDIEDEYGAKALSKAKDYVFSKIQSLKQSEKDGEDITSSKAATPFVLFAVKLESIDSLDQVVKDFEADNQQVSNDSDDISVNSLLSDVEVNTDKEPKGEDIVKEIVCDSIEDPKSKSQDQTSPIKPATQSSTKQFVIPQTKKTSKFFSIPDKSKISKPSSSTSESEDKKDDKNDINSNSNNNSNKQEKKEKKSKMSYKDSSNKDKKKLNNGSSSKHKDKAKKDLLAPKGASSAYIFYVAQVRSDNPNKEAKSILQLAGTQWKELSETEKLPYIQLATQDKLRAKVELEAYYKQYPDRIPHKGKYISSSNNIKEKEGVRKENHHNDNNNKKKNEKKNKDQKMKQKRNSYDSDDETAVVEEEDDNDDEEEGNEEDNGYKRKNNISPNNSQSSSSSLLELSQKIQNTPTSINPKRKNSSSSSSSSSSNTYNNTDKDTDMTPPQSPTSNVTGYDSDHNTVTVSRCKQTKKSYLSSHTKDKLKTNLFFSTKTMKESSNKISTVSGTAGLIQKDKYGVPIELLAQSTILPTQKFPYPADYIPRVRDPIVLILEPYREYIQTLTDISHNSYNPKLIDALSGVTDITKLSQVLEDMKSLRMVSGIIQSTEDIDITIPLLSNHNNNSTTEDNEEEDSDCTHHTKDKTTTTTTTTTTVYILHIFLQKKEYTILYHPYSSNLLTTDIYLLHKREYLKSMSTPWLILGAQIKRGFSYIPPITSTTTRNDNNHNNKDDDKDDEGDEEKGCSSNSNNSPCLEYIEGIVYNIREDYKLNPYHSISIIWLDQDTDYNWMYRYIQTDSYCSPWDLELSNYILLKNIHKDYFPDLILPPNNSNDSSNTIMNISDSNITNKRMKITKSLHGKISDTMNHDYVQHQKMINIIEYIMNLETSYPFLVPIQECPEFLERFPNETDHLDLHIIKKKIVSKQYKHNIDISINLSSITTNITTNTSTTSTSYPYIDWLFHTLFHMISNGKLYNESNKEFQVWKLMDVVEKMLSRLYYHWCLSCNNDSTNITIAAPAATTTSHTQNDTISTMKKAFDMGNNGNLHSNADNISSQLYLSQRLSQERMLSQERYHSQNLLNSIHHSQSSLLQDENSLYMNEVEEV